MPFKDAYDEAASRHKLPAYRELAKLVDLSLCEREEFPLRQARAALGDMLESWADLLEKMLSPEQGNSASLFESRFFTDKDHESTFNLFKRLMIVIRMFDEASVLCDEKTDADALRSALSELPSLRRDVAVFVRQLRDSWQKTSGSGSDVGYLG
jgi:hypothetical protein